MERTRKMVIIPEETLMRMQQQQQQHNAQESNSSSSSSTETSVQTPGDRFSRLDSEMFDILNSKKFTNLEEKCKNYLQVLRRYLFHKDSERFVQTAEAEEEETEKPIDQFVQILSEQNILEAVPKTHVQKARVLLSHWRTNEPDRLKWDSAGRVTVDGRTIPGSNIIELLNYALKKQKNKKIDAPLGRHEFAKFIGNSDTPTDLIGNLDIFKISEKLNSGSSLNKKKRKTTSELQSMENIKRKTNVEDVAKSLALRTFPPAGIDRAFAPTPRNKSQILSPIQTRAARLNKKWKKIADF